MAEIHFYHLQRQPLEAVLPTLIEKSLGRGWRAVVQATSAERLSALDDHLWTFSDDSFLAHATDKEPDAVFFYELYTDEDALTAHGSSDRFKEIGKSLRDLAGGRPELTILTPVIGKGL